MPRKPIRSLSWATTGAVLLFASLVGGSAVAAPCTDNRWQPTFVHDLEIQDGPYYTVGNGFTRLRYDPAQQFVPHACELIDASGVRDRRGYTTCQQYTRIQCGCSRTQSLGNSTCAAFLAWRPVYYVPAGTRQLTAAGPGQALPIRFSPDESGLLVGSVPANELVEVEGICTGNFCRIRYAGMTGWADIRALSQPGQTGVSGIGMPGNTGLAGSGTSGGGMAGGTGLEGLPGDGLTGMTGYPGLAGLPGMSGMSGVSGMSGMGQAQAGSCQRVTQWRRMANRRGPAQARGGDLVLTGGKWSNGRLKNGDMDGNGVESAQSYDFSGGGTARMQFTVNGGGKYMSIVPIVLKGARCNRVSTGNSWSGSAVVKDGTRLYGEVNVSPGGSYKLTVSTRGFGQSPIVSGSGNLPAGPTQFAVEFVDNYASQKSSIVLHETEVCLGGGGSHSGVIPNNTGLFAPPSATPPAPPSPGGGRACSTNADCGGALCLLGVCAN